MAGPRGGGPRALRRVMLAGAVAALTVAGTLGPGALAGTASTASSGASAASAKPIKGVPGGPAARPEPHAIVEVVVDDRAELDRLVGTGVDLTEHIEAENGSTVTQAVVTPSEEADLRESGFEIGRTVQSQSDTNAVLRERDRAISRLERAERRTARLAAPAAATDEVRIARADYFTSLGEQFLSVEAKSSELDAATLTVRWDSGPGTPMGSGGSAELEPFVDADVYLYHRGENVVDARPSRIEVTSSSGGSATAEVEDWLPGTGQPEPEPYFKDFVEHYMDPTELQDRIKALADEFPGKTELIELPNKTNGYRRKAQAILGSADTEEAAASAVVLTSRAWGHEGGNDLSAALNDPDEADQELEVEVDGNQIEIDLATDSTGAITTTAAEVVEAIEDSDAADQLVIAHTFRGSPGDGVVRPQFETPLTDFLSAPQSISREPYQPLALRIGKHMDGSRVGVMAYAQEHAREWVPPLVTVESAERLLRNYRTDRQTKRLVNNLDIFIVPSVNTDGGHYSFYDFSQQRKNMFNHCPPSGPADPAARNSWGVDVNRNYPVGSLFDGYFGGSASCTSGNYSGPFERSEPESRNVLSLPEKYPNIRFSMNLHSSGNYFMWSPGAYKVPGRETLPRPTLGEESYFYEASNRILTAIKRHRGLSVTPARTGPIADVLYSAAGNSGDALWYDHDIFAWNFEVGTEFQPEWDEAHAEAMEFSNGLVELMNVARDFSRDDDDPTSELVPGPGDYPGPIEVKFETSEPATIYYTTNGRRPTFESPQYEAAGIREGGESIPVDRTTIFRWFSVDAAGNIEGDYDPDGTGDDYREATYRIGQP
jgi:Zinc carboxypeptidase/Chitobiase/beta-hexosaminidase C-terminal domain